ncbi:hypothetical protein BS47DRAFT_318854 [Hydnum rufescens UP504]|uniref:Uncharacterized protein n=1 Tax=Hydnum rufescens UP504 TaxID=1448309 RepID=A0A9P6AL56_9AGAM|nr:hypothetical protein BS47DRAFT_318854 [Hydnum rufescens UP504]
MREILRKARRPKRRPVATINIILWCSSILNTSSLVRYCHSGLKREDTKFPEVWRLGWDAKIRKRYISRGTYFPKCLSKAVSPGRLLPYKIEDGREGDTEFSEGWRLGWGTKTGKRHIIARHLFPKIYLPRSFPRQTSNIPQDQGRQGGGYRIF